MDQLNYNDPAYESDEYFDEMGNKVREIDYSVPPFALKSKPVQDAVRPGNSVEWRSVPKNKDITKMDPDCGNVTSVEMKDNIVEVKQEKTVDYVPRYTIKDLSPTIRDPLCRSNSQLACYWPVYVGNFKCENRKDEFNCVKEYFAWKGGLHVCWWFRKIDEYYYDFQSKAGIFDMLVYFLSKQDADYAIRKCHRDIYKGYPLNVFPGREPVYFDSSRSLQAFKMKSGRVYSELFFEKHVKFILNVNVTCAVKFDTKSGAMEFATSTDKAIAKKKERLFKFEDIPTKLRKQRFLEQDLLRDIEAHLTYDPDVFKADPKSRYLHLLLDNIRPLINPNPKMEVVPLRRGPPRHVMQKHLQEKIKKNQKQIERALERGRNPHCFSKSKGAKKRFKKMLEEIKKNPVRKRNS